MRYVTICTWNGPKRSTICHVSVHPNRSPYRDITAIQFTDGTTADVETRPMLPRERIKELRGYPELLDEFTFRGMKGFCRVSDLLKSETKNHSTL